MAEFVFDVPPEAPVFYPTVDEFEDPLIYINKIRPVAEKAGICKIIPPTNWHPPFALDVDKFRFVPRIQRLNELEAQTRIKINFLNEVLIFWKMQGTNLKIPLVGDNTLDLYSLHKVVEENGGYLKVCENHLWSVVAKKLELSGICIFNLKTYYSEILYPFDLFKLNKQTVKSNNLEKKENLQENNEELADDKLEFLESFYLQKNNNEESNLFQGDVESNNLKFSSELRRLKFYGAGPKMAGYNATLLETRKRKLIIHDDDLLRKYICSGCGRSDHDESMLLCRGCDDSFHLFCLIPSLDKIPNGAWYCPNCINREITNSIDGFGFHLAEQEYTLQEFGEMADSFKCNYFNLPTRMIPISTIEKEYWRIMSSSEEDVTVEYGADLHTMDHGSGFPTKESLNIDQSEKEYVESKWNLNNLPVLKGSVLNYVKGNISGMKLPWMYVGMCFATFCWHNEDHWTYSINYLHWGEPKTWYGVPGDSAEPFEECMKYIAPELFEAQPDLLHQLVTMLNPNSLMKKNIPVYRTDQKAGEFVITFPRAYHAGFNQGYNFAEAVNFAPAEWIRMGRECINHYSYLRRLCVFSHDELVCTMALESDKLDLIIAAATYKDMMKMVYTEKNMRKRLWDWGIKNAKFTAFEHISEEKRQCIICNTICFLSAVTCECNLSSVVCLRHYVSVCCCLPSKRTLQFRYTLDQLTSLLQKLKFRAESFDRWIKKVEDVISEKEKVTLATLKSLYLEAENHKFPICDLLNSLNEIILKSEKCLEIIKQHSINRNKNVTLSLTLQDLKILWEEIKNSCCMLEEADYIKELLDNSSYVMNQADSLLLKNIFDNNVTELEKCYKFGISLGIELPVLKPLKIRLDQVKWLASIGNNMNNLKKVPIDYLQKCLKIGFTLPTHEVIEIKLEELQNLLSHAEDWERKAKQCLLSNSLSNIYTMQLLLKEAKSLKIDLPTEHILHDTYKLVSDWVKLVSDMNSMEYYPHYNTLKMVINKGYNLPLLFKEIKPLEVQLNLARLWKQNASHIFLGENSPYNLMQVIWPRSYEIPELNNEFDFTGLSIENSIKPGQIVTTFKFAEQQEIIVMKEKQKYNNEKVLDSSRSATYCVCGQSKRDIMIQCKLCKDLFHINCVKIPEHILSQLPNLELINKLMFRYFCPNCSRSKRPNLNEILSLLMKLQELHVRLDEGEALLCLTERILNWQDRVRKVLRQYSPFNTFNKSLKTNNSIIELSAIISMCVTDLVLEGDLLEVTVNETEEIWKLYQYSKHTFERDRLLYDFRTEINIGNPQCSSMYLNGQNSFETDDLEKKKTNKKRKKIQTNVQSNDVIVIDDDDECAALSCLKPTGDTIDWVQCDGKCARWFHLTCLGFTMKQLSLIEDYICINCVEQESISV